jgi:hypothetical protein
MSLFRVVEKKGLPSGFSLKPRAVNALTLFL